MSLVLQDDYAQEHESTTAFTTYSGVLYPPTETLPLMNYNSKAGILGLDKKAVSDVQQLDLKILFNTHTHTALVSSCCGSSHAAICHCHPWAK